MTDGQISKHPNIRNIPNKIKRKPSTYNLLLLSVCTEGMFSPLLCIYVSNVVCTLFSLYFVPSRTIQEKLKGPSSFYGPEGF